MRTELFSISANVKFPKQETRQSFIITAFFKCEGDLDVASLCKGKLWRYGEQIVEGQEMTVTTRLGSSLDNNAY